MAIKRENYEIPTSYEFSEGLLVLNNDEGVLADVGLETKDPKEVAHFVEDWIEQGETVDSIVEGLLDLADFDPDAPDDEELFSGNVVPKKYKDKYGKKQNCGDSIAQAIVASVTSYAVTDTKKGQRKTKIVDFDALHAIQNANGIEEGRWGNLNPGMQVMNTSNVLRGKFWKGEKVVINMVTFDLTKAVKKMKNPKIGNHSNKELVAVIKSCGEFPVGPKQMAALVKLLPTE